MNPLDHVRMALGLAEYSRAAEDACDLPIATRLMVEARSHLALAAGEAGEVLGCRVPAMGGVAA